MPLPALLLPVWALANDSDSVTATYTLPVFVVFVDARGTHVRDHKKTH